MKKFTLWYAAFVGCAIFMFSVKSTSALAGQVTYSDSWGPKGIALTGQNAQGLTLNFSMYDFTMDDCVRNGQSMQEIGLDGVFLPNNEGAPNLPVLSRFIAVPNGAQVSVEVVKSRTEAYHNVNLAPAPHIPLDNERGPLQYNKDLSIFSKDAFYPAQPVSVSGLHKMRGVSTSVLSITPYQYNPVTKELLVYRDIEVKISFTGGDGQFGESRLRDRFWEPILMDNLLNHNSLPAFSTLYQSSGNNKTTTATGCEYLIIVPNDAIFSQWADSIKAFRTEQGILTKVVTLSQIGGNTTSAIENYINNAYNTWDIPPSAILMMADYGTNASNSITAPIWDSYCVSDNIYGDVDNDDLPDIAMARMTANNASQLETYCRKFLDYERNPPTDPNFYKKPITALGWQTERWFQICSEVIGGFLKYGLGKQPVRVNAVYDGNPDVDPWSTATNTNTVVTYFGPSGLNYIPSNPQALGGWTGGTASIINQNLNAGAFMLQHRDHGMETGWGEPSYTNSSIDGLTNVGKLAYIFSVNCLTGKYNYSAECFAEKFHRYKYNGQNAGCVGILAASETSYSFVNDTYVWGLMDNLWPQFMPAYGEMFQQRGLLPCFGNAAGKYFLAQSSWPYNTSNKVVTYHLFHHHGDAFLTLFSEVPSQITVSHAEVMIETATAFDVTADEGSFIALTANGQIIGTGEGTGAPVAIPVTPPAIGTQVKVVVTKQNCYRHYSYVTVISAENPYVVTDSFEINDATGNNNQQADFGENLKLSLSEENLGNNPANNVVVTISGFDPYFNITDNSQAYPTIASHAIVSVPDGFGIQVANNVPDGYSKMFTASATNGTDTWVSYFTMSASAPKLNAGMFVVDDTQQGNGNHRLDAGDTAVIRIPVTNSGSSIAPDVQTTLSISGGFVELLNTSASVGALQPLGTSYAEFTVYVVDPSPFGSPITLNFTAISGAYSVQRAFNTQINLIVEDWETGDFTKFDWQSSGNLPWTIVNSGTYEGVYSAKSGAIGNSQTSQMFINYDVPTNDSISFYYKVSSEPTFDGLRFFIDNVQKGSYSGNTPWSRASFPITAGSHTFKWVYTKNNSNTGGMDCAWLDFIVLPAPLTTAAYAGGNGYTCESTPYTCQGFATNYNSILWTSSGSGTFSDPTILNPVYTASAADIAAGSVMLTMDVIGLTGNVADHMVLTFEKPATAYAGSSSTICSDSPVTLAGQATHYSHLEWTTTGTGQFSAPAELNTDYTPSAADVAQGSVTLTLHASNAACTPAASSVTITIHPSPSPSISGSSTECALTGGVIYSTPVATNTTYTWSVEGGTIQSGAGTPSIVVDWGQGANGKVSLLETSNFQCSTLQEYAITINPLPNTAINGPGSRCAGENGQYSTPQNSDNTYTWVVTGGELFSGAGTSQIEVNWSTAGNAQLQLTETVTATQCSRTVNFPVIVNGQATAPSMPSGSNQVDVEKTLTSEYVASNAQYAESYSWELLPATAGTFVANGNKITLTWNKSFRGTATLRAKAVNPCNESSYSDALTINVMSSYGIGETPEHLEVTILPNPASEHFTIRIASPTALKADVRIAASSGSIVYEQSGVDCMGTVNLKPELKLAPGTYHVQVITSQGTALRKLVVR